MKNFMQVAWATPHNPLETAATKFGK